MPNIWAPLVGAFSQDRLRAAYHNTKQRGGAYHSAARDELCRRAFARR